MAINVTLGEAKTQEKPFPKLMKHSDGTITRFTSFGNGIHIHRNDDDADTILWKEIKGIGMANYTDYNEPITLQNA